jgi:hypothetical protein
VLRTLGRNPSSSGTLRTARGKADAFRIDYSHFTGQRRWSDGELADAIATADTWREVLARLGLADSAGNERTVRTRATRLSLDTSRFGARRSRSESSLVDAPDPKHLRTAGSTLAAAWFMLRGYEVLWPLEPCRYDLAVRAGNGYERVQVKTVTYRSDDTYVARLANSRSSGQQVYTPDEIDCFFVIDADLNAYLIPFADVAGYQTIYLRHYEGYLVADRGQLLQQPAVPRAAS